MEGFRISAGDAMARLAAADGPRFARVFEHGTLIVEVYAPRDVDPQQPHVRDEIYVVVEGHGDFIMGDRRHAFQPGDFLFVPAGLPHRFDRFSDDLVVWGMFYGPAGGEAGTAPARVESSES